MKELFKILDVNTKLIELVSDLNDLKLSIRDMYDKHFSGYRYSELKKIYNINISLLAFIIKNYFSFGSRELNYKKRKEVISLILNG